MKKLSPGAALAHAEKQLDWALTKEINTADLIFRMYHQLHDAGIQPDVSSTERRHIDNMKHLVQTRDNRKEAVRKLR